MASKMADKKRNASRSQSAALKTQAPEKEQAAKNVKATAHEERKKEQSKQMNKPAVRRDSKSSRSLTARIRSNRVGRFLYDSYYELRHKVTWPTFIEARNMTIIVILLSAAVGAILALADFGLYHLFALISGGR